MPRQSQLIFNTKWNTFVEEGKPVLVMKCKVCSQLNLLREYQYNVAYDTGYKWQVIQICGKCWK